MDRRAVAAVLRAERVLGRQPEEMPHNNKGYDIRSLTPDGHWVFIEVKGRILGAEDFIVTRNEVLYGKNADRYRLGSPQHRQAHRPWRAARGRRPSPQQAVPGNRCPQRGGRCWRAASLKAQRLGLEAHASDPNPVAVLICKALIEIPPKWAGRSPVIMDRSNFRAALEEAIAEAANGLAADIKIGGQRAIARRIDESIAVKL